eukprot:jgi/Orpsp1_1/1180977/evm.model.c7180000075322.2
MINQPFRYYCIIDFEATNEENPNEPGHGFRDYPSEIIQFPAVLVDSTTNRIVDKFNKYVRPTRNPTLSRFIRNLTNISQQQVNNADIFVTVLKQFEDWLSTFSPKPFRNVCFVTDGDCDFGRFLKLQCEFSNISLPSYVRSYLDIKYLFMQYSGRYRSIRGMLNYIGTTFEGRNHNGLDDSINIARVVIYMLRIKRLDNNKTC